MSSIAEARYVAEGIVIRSIAVDRGTCAALSRPSAATKGMDVALLNAVVMARDLHVAMMEDVVLQESHVVESFVVLLGHPVVITPRPVVTLVRRVVATSVARQTILFVAKTSVILQGVLVVIICTLAALGKVVVREAVALSMKVLYYLTIANLQT